MHIEISEDVEQRFCPSGDEEQDSDTYWVTAPRHLVHKREPCIHARS